MNRKHGLLLFLCALVPGCGQMYQGYMKRGISLTFGFAAILAVAGFLSIAPLAFFLPVVWLYAFFDCYNLRARADAGFPAEDAYLFGLSEMDSQQMTALLKKRHSIIGWGLVILGIYMLYDTFMRRIMNVISDIPGLEWTYGLVVYDLPRLVITVLVILLGIWFIRGPKQRPSDEIPAFTPPDAGYAGPNVGQEGVAQEETRHTEQAFSAGEEASDGND